MNGETDQIRARYEKRLHSRREGEDYDIRRPDQCLMEQETERAILSLLSRFDRATLKSLKVLEIGCGGGANLLQLLRWGFPPENIQGCELMAHHCASARRHLPPAVEIIEGDALALPLPDAAFDIVLVSTVFTSILDEGYRSRLARKIWSLVRPGGAVLWYDFAYDNPANPDVKAVSRRRLLELFPEASADIHKVTLAPPLARVLCKLHPKLYPMANTLRILRTHLVAWLQKPAQPRSNDPDAPDAAWGRQASARDEPPPSTGASRLRMAKAEPTAAPTARHRPAKPGSGSIHRDATAAARGSLTDAILARGAET